MTNRKRLTNAALSFAMPAALAAAPALLAAPVQAQDTAADLRILSPRAGESVDSGSFALDVSFKSRSQSAIVTAELWVDGTRWVSRDLGTPQLKNVLSFDVDASTLSEGKHTFLIRVFDANGGSSEKSTTLQLAGKANDTAAGETGFGPEMKFLSPGNDKRVAGVVELQLDAKPRNGVNPYVTFYVDKQFKTLKNYPPYSFNWDSTTVENGYHIVEAMGYLDSSNASTTRRLRVYVDNPGGNTTLKSDIPDLSKARQQAPVTAVQATVKPLAIPIHRDARVNNAGVSAKSAAMLVASGLSAMHTDLAPHVSSEAKVLARRVRESLTPISVDMLPAISHNAAPRTTAPRLAKPAGHLSAKAMVSTVTPTDTFKTVHPVAPSLAPANLSAFATTTTAPNVVGTLARPTAGPEVLKSTYRPEIVAVQRIASGMSLAAPAAPHIMSIPAATRRVSVAKPVQQGMVPVVVHKTSKAAPRAVLGAPLTTLNGILKAKPLQIAFDGQQIAFDVRPRIEKGLPIAPFRQIFEHTGGQVMWLRQTHTVRAVNADHEIVISVGKKSAIVNGETFRMDRAATIEHGRTIVPLSFVKDALDVNVKYDPATGHLDITSKN